MLWMAFSVSSRINMNDICSPSGTREDDERELYHKDGRTLDGLR